MAGAANVAIALSRNELRDSLVGISVAAAFGLQRAGWFHAA